jgi:hypothetical protein
MERFFIYSIFAFWLNVLILLYIYLKGKILNPAFLFLVIALIDVFFPSIIAAYNNYFQVPVWAKEININDIMNGVIYYSIYFFIFFFFILIGNKLFIFRNSIIPQLTNKLDNKILLHTIFLFSLSCLKIFNDIYSIGGFNNYLLKSAVLSVTNESVNASEQSGSFLTRFPIISLFQAFVGLAFFYRKNSRYKLLNTWIFPIFSILFSLTTLLRGSLIYVFVVLILAEILRKNPNGFYIKFKSKLKISKGVLITFFSIIIFVSLFGAIRDNFRSEISGSDDSRKSISIVPNFLSQGSGLMGVTSIVQNFGTNINFLNGKTFIDMILLPVPRSIYKSKPEWYGIDDISRSMGWPETTQSAVTMPGEAFANFGFYGFFLAIPFGLLFGIADKFIKKDIVYLIIIGPIFYFQMLTVTNWMSFTGLMSSLMVIIAITIYYFIFFKTSLK